MVKVKLSTISVIPMCTISASGNRKSCLGPIFPTIYDFRSIQFSDTLMSDGYLDIFFVQSLLVTSPIIFQMLKYLFSSVQCNTKFVQMRKSSIFSNCETPKLVFCLILK